MSSVAFFAMSPSPPIAPPRANETSGFSPDGQQLVTACADGLVRAWSWRDETPPLVLARTFLMPAAAFLPEENQVLVADHTEVSLGSSRGILLLERKIATPGSLRWTLDCDRRRAMLISSATPPQLFHPKDLSRINSLALTDATLRRVGYGADGRFILRSWVEGSPQTWNVGLWELTSGRRI